MNLLNIKKYIIALYILLPMSYLHAQPIVNNEVKNSGFLPLPILAYSPETQVLFGASLLYFLNNSSYPDSKTDRTSLFLIYTQLDQIISGITTTNFFADNKWMIKSLIYFSKFPNRFYGIGPNTSSDMQEKYLPVETRFRASLLRKIYKNLYIGPRYRVVYYEITETKAGRLLSYKIIPGSKKAFNSGIGAEIIWDERDNIFNPINGYYFQARILSYNRYLRSEYTFFTAIFDYRHYINFTDRNILALQLYMHIGEGDMPFQLMAKIGGEKLLRGYYRGRYRDKNLAAVQAEYRFPIFMRVGGVIFGGAGQVAPSITRMNFTNIKASAGTGLRFTVNKQQRIKLRLDFGFYDIKFAKDSYGIYFSFIEAF